MPSPSKPPQTGDIVHARMRTYLVEGVEPSTGYGTLVSAACMDDDAQGQTLQVVWELEPDARVIDEDAWKSIGSRGFDNKRWFAAYLHALRWNCVTSTDPRLFQSPFRAGIKIDAYQLEPLRKALQLPRVNLFIADDVGLGKTIEAGLIASELLLRRRVREIVVACPPSMISQWQDEMESRFGLVFDVLDREYVDRVRRERGFATNPWTTSPRFIVSHNLLVDEGYAGPLRAWLTNLKPATLLILDEAHHAAPASGSKYAIDSRTTRAIRDLSPRFEHRLFLSATPHNGHSNSFSALLELLDSQRFTRGTPVEPRNVREVIVRRLKDDIRNLQGGFPERKVVQVDLPRDVGLASFPPDMPEIQLSRLLNEYREVREQRLAGATKRQQSQAALLMSGLQQRLLSSIEAFARTLAVHRRTMERIWAGERMERVGHIDITALAASPEADDDRSLLSDDDLQDLETSTFRSATIAASGNAGVADEARERALIDEMERIANGARYLPDARVHYLVEWVRRKMCAGARLPDEPVTERNAGWNDIRLLIFTEYEATRHWLVSMLQNAIRDTENSQARIEVFSGQTSQQRRDSIKRVFNMPPSQHPLRILVATDAAREGLNLQSHCFNLFHLDVPWNPSRLEQRNGRIDRKLQPAEMVFCHYFVYTDRAEDRVLRTLVRKTTTIRKELGSLSQVLETRLAEMLQSGGIRHSEVESLAAEIDAVGPDPDARAVVEEELESTRKREKDVAGEIETLRTYLNNSRRRIGLDEHALGEALSVSLEMLGVEPLQAATGPTDQPRRFTFPNLGVRHGGDPSWAGTLDTLRTLPEDGERSYRWRRESPIRPVIFNPLDTIDDDVVQLHLSHRVVQRLLSRFSAQGFVYHDLSRACLAQTEDAIPRVVLLGRLSLYGNGATRLHEELLTVTARWIAPDLRKAPLTPYARDAEARTIDLLEASLLPNSSAVNRVAADRLQSSIVADIGDLLPHLYSRGKAGQDEAERRLRERGRIESEAMIQILDTQKRKVEESSARSQTILPGTLPTDEARQLEADRRAWSRYLISVVSDRETEPKRIRDFYVVKSARIEPVGVAYLWPVTG